MDFGSDLFPELRRSFDIRSRVYSLKDQPLKFIPRFFYLSLLKQQIDRVSG